MNYFNDARTKAPRTKAQSKGQDFTILSERGSVLRIQFDESLVELLIEEEAQGADWDGILEVPFKYDVCPLCEGRGTHTNPSIDCGGLSVEDFAEDPDFAEEYLGGKYDVPCYECHGKRVVPVVELPPAVQKVLDGWHQSLADSRRCEMYERMAGA